jgi:lipopolysaccharide/colanic/teichoic acid biosynthesis glycosyltransferase
MSITYNGKLVPETSILLRSQRLLKAVLDSFGAVIGLTLTFPIFLAISIMLKIQRENVFFRQDRVGLDQKTFKMLKFTTMVKGAEKQGTITRSGDSRITVLGRFLRRFKLNELPQIINVLKGEMSFVGPRPLPRSEVEEYYSPEDRASIYSVKPGITGRGSIEFSDEEEHLNEVDDFEDYFAREIMPKKAKLEIWYVNNWSIILDLELLLGTIIKLSETFLGRSFARSVGRKR